VGLGEKRRYTIKDAGQFWSSVIRNAVKLDIMIPCKSWDERRKIDRMKKKKKEKGMDVGGCICPKKKPTSSAKRPVIATP